MIAKEFGINNNKPYPFVVVRFMPAIYGRASLVFLGEEDQNSRRGIFVPVKRPDDRIYSQELRNAVASEVLMHVRAKRLRVWCVFGPKAALYVEPDGSCDAKTLVQSGGLELDEIVATKN